MVRRTRLRRALLAALALTAIGMLVAACGGSAAGSGASSGSGSSSSGGSGSTASSGTPKEGGDVTFLIQEFPIGWVSSESSISSYEGNLWGEITDKLVYVDAKGNVSPWVLSSWQTEDGAKKFILHIKPGITFSDGEKMDAAAVIDNINLWAHGDTKRGIAQVGLFPALNYTGAKAINSSTVEVDFSKPTLGFIPTLGYHGCILLSPKTLAGSVNQQANLLTEYGSGPFVVKSYKQGVSYTLVKRKDYNWGPEALGHTGPAYLNSITYKIVADSSTREQAVEAGDAQVDFNPNVSDISQLEGQGLQVTSPKYLGFTDGFQVDAGIAPTNNLQVRQAIEHAINRQQINSTVYPAGFTSPATSFVQSNVPGAANDSSLFAYNPTESKKLLAEAGYTKGSDGYLQKAGKDLSLTLYPNPYVPATSEEDQLIAQQLKAVGIKAPLDIVPLANFAAFFEKPPLPALSPVSRSFVDFSTVGGVLTSLSDGQNWFGLGTSDKTLDSLSQQIEGAATQADRASAEAAVQKYVLSQGLFVPTTEQVQRIYALAKNLHGVTYNGVAYANLYTAYLTS
jgi:peptide/nickel transport system substrate-binding protein